MLAAGAAWFVTRIVCTPDGSAKPRGISKNVVPATVLSAEIAGNPISCHNHVFALVVAPDATVLRNTRPTVAVVVVGAVAVGMNRTR